VQGISQGAATITVNTADGKGKAAQTKIVVPESANLSFWRDDYWGDKISEEYAIRLTESDDIYVYSKIPYEDITNVHS